MAVREIKLKSFRPIGAHTHITDLSSAVTLTPETNATAVLIQPTGQNVRVTLGGTTPTSTLGFRVAVGEERIIDVTNEVTIKVIEETAGATLEVQSGKY